MNKNFEKVLKIILKWEHLGVVKLNNGVKAIKIAHIPRDFPKAYLHTFFKGLSELEIDKMENALGKKFSTEFRNFLESTNGLDLFISNISVMGKRLSYERKGDEAIQPIDLVDQNIHNLLATIPNTWLWVATYSQDGSRVYVDSQNGKTFRCSDKSTKIAQTWDNFWEWLISETQRYSDLYGTDGYKKTSK